LADHERPLAPRGIRACARLRDHIRQRGLAPDLVLCSSASRALHTWEGIRAGVTGVPKVRVEDALYTAGAEQLLHRLHDVAESVESALLIGHNPAIEDLAICLAADGDDRALQALRAKYPTGALASLAFSGEWKALACGNAWLESFIVPRQLK
jgi:phosphohistidine phosphatase